MYSALKGIPVLLIGASLSKLVLEGKEIRNKMLPIATTIIVFYMVLMLVLGSGLVPLLMPVWIYPHAVLFITAGSMFLFALFQIIEAKQIHLGPIQALGRTSIVSYTGQFVILLPVLSLLGYPVDNIGLLFILSIVSEMIIMALAYLYCRRKWGSPSSW
jgi:Na+-driven multidrug efflux pump